MSPTCALHKRHAPRNYTLELHHVIPRAWQRFWVPPGVGIVHDPNYGDLWAPADTIILCPTGHRNVHFWIVASMHTLHQAASGDPAIAAQALRGAIRRDKCWPTAYDALLHYTKAGGDLLALTNAHEWGEA